MTATPFYVIRSSEARSRASESLDEDNRPTGSDLLVVYRYGVERDVDGDVEIGYDPDIVVDWFDGPIPDPVLDLIEIALATYAADRATARRTTIVEDDYESRLGTRNIRLAVPVLSRRFATADAERLLSEVVSRTTRDIFEYETHRPGPRMSHQLSERDGGMDAISLFSGGLDSTGGIFYNRRHGIDASYLTLNYADVGPLTDTIAAQTAIEADTVPIHYAESAADYTQFSRGFLHLAFGTAAALGRGASVVQSFENGIIARFLVLQDAWMTTRTVEPTFLARFNALLDQVYDVDIRVQNPFETWTKAEVADLFPDAELVARTVSCPHQQPFNHRELDHCGLCIPCSLRTLSLLASSHPWSLEEHTIHAPFTEADFETMTLKANVKSAPNVEVNKDAVGPDVFLKGVAEMAFFCRQLLYGRESELARDYPALYDPDIYDLHRRFADEFETAIARIGSVNSTASELVNS